MFYLWWNFLLVIGSPSQRPGTGWGARRWEKDCPLPRLPGQAPHPGYERRRARPLRHQLCHPNCRSEPQEGPRSPLLSGVKTEQRVHSYTLFFFLLVQISSFTCDSWKAFLWYLELTDQTVSNFSYLLQRFWPILTVTKISPSSLRVRCKGWVSKLILCYPNIWEFLTFPRTQRHFGGRLSLESELRTAKRQIRRNETQIFQWTMIHFLKLHSSIGLSDTPCVMVKHLCTSCYLFTSVFDVWALVSMEHHEPLFDPSTVRTDQK